MSGRDCSDIPTRELDALTRAFDDDAASARQVWAVHGDRLLESGDPRGEVIALELTRAKLPEGSERASVDAQLAQLAAAHGTSWLGTELAALVDATQARDGWVALLRWRYGYLAAAAMSLGSSAAADQPEVLTTLLDSSAARYLADLTIHVGRDRRRAMIDQIAACEPPLTRLTLFCSPYPREESAAVDGAAAEKLASALPRLESLRVVGRAVLARFAHPTLRELTLGGHDALGELALPRLERLDLSLMAGTLTEALSREPLPALEVWLGDLLGGRGFPALRELDLSRNNEGARSGGAHLGGRAARLLADETLLSAPLLAQLDRLSLPSPKTAEEVDRLVAAAARLAHLQRLRIPRVYRYGSTRVDLERLQHALPNLEIGCEYPHRTAVDVHGREVVEIAGSEDEYGELIGFKTLVELVDDAYDDLSSEARRALGVLLETWEGLAYGDDDDDRPLTAELPTAPLRPEFTELEQILGPFEDRRLTVVVECLERCERIRLEKEWGW